MKMNRNEYNVLNEAFWLLAIADVGDTFSERLDATLAELNKMLNKAEIDDEENA